LAAEIEKILREHSDRPSIENARHFRKAYRIYLSRLAKNIAIGYDTFTLEMLGMAKCPIGAILF
jgi:hypothetical protein